MYGIEKHIEIKRTHTAVNGNMKMLYMVLSWLFYWSSSEFNVEDGFHTQKPEKQKDKNRFRFIQLYWSHVGDSASSPSSHKAQQYQYHNIQ